MRILLLIVGGPSLVWSTASQTSLRATLVVGHGLNEPFAVDFDGDGRMFIAEMAGNRVTVWDQARLTPLSTPFNGPHHLLTGPDSFIYVADTWNHMVRRAPATGAVTRVAGTGVKGFNGVGSQYGQLPDGGGMRPRVRSFLPHGSRSPTCHGRRRPGPGDREAPGRGARRTRLGGKRTRRCHVRIQPFVSS